MTKRLLVARLWLEVNSFSPLPTGRDEFEGMEWLRGLPAIQHFRDTPTELAAVLDFVAARPDWSVTVSRAAAAPPGGPMEEALFEAFLADLEEDLARGPWDAVYLSLHGALVTGGRPSPDLDILKLVRERVGRVPIGASFDMHANLGARHVALVDVAAGYKTLPHLDMRETATKVLRLLAETVEGRCRPVGRIVRPGFMPHSFNMRTSDGPMMELEGVARGLTTGPILDVTPFGGFPFADSPDTGASAMVYADGDAAAAERVAHEMAAEMRARARAFDVDLPGADEGLRRALAQPLRPVCVLESADNTYSGGIADTPALFAALVRLKPAIPTVFAFFCDPGVVAAARAAGEGGRIDCRLGGRVTDAFGPPVPVSAVVRRLTAGKFVNHGPMYRGVAVDVGPSAVLDVDGVLAIVTSRREPVNDLAFFELHGIDVTKLGLLGVKAKNHFRGSFTHLIPHFVEIDTPGPAGVDLRALPFKHADLAQLDHDAPMRGAAGD